MIGSHRIIRKKLLSESYRIATQNIGGKRN